MTNTTKTAPAKIACAKCGTKFVPAKPWARFCSTACRNTAHQRERYADSRKATKALPKAREKIANLRAVLLEVEAFLSHGNPSSDEQDLIDKVRAARR